MKALQHNSMNHAPLIKGIHNPDKMADTIEYKCTLPLKVKWRDKGNVPHMFVRNDFSRRDGSQVNQYDSMIKADKIGLRAFVSVGAIVKVECDLPKLIYGHNGRLINSQAQLYLALDRLEHILGILCDPLESLGGFVPGRPEHENVHFTRVDFAWQFPDPDLRLANMMRQAVHPGILKANIQYPTGTRSPGTNLVINAYEKAAKLKVECEERYFRIEVQIKKYKLGSLFKGDKDAKLTKLDFWEAYQVYRDVLLQMDRPAVAVCGKKATVAEAIAQMQLKDLGRDIASEWKELRYSTTRTERIFQKDYTAALQDAMSSRFADLLPQDALPPVHEITHKKKEDMLWNEYVVPFDWPTGEADPLAPENA